MDWLARNRAGRVLENCFPGSAGGTRTRSNAESAVEAAAVPRPGYGVAGGQRSRAENVVEDAVGRNPVVGGGCDAA